MNNNTGQNTIGNLMDNFGSDTAKRFYFQVCVSIIKWLETEGADKMIYEKIEDFTLINEDDKLFIFQVKSSHSKPKGVGKKVKEAISRLHKILHTNESVESASLISNVSYEYKRKNTTDGQPFPIEFKNMKYDSKKICGNTEHKLPIYEKTKMTLSGSKDEMTLDLAEILEPMIKKEFPKLKKVQIYKAIKLIISFVETLSVSTIDHSQNIKVVADLSDDYVLKKEEIWYRFEIIFSKGEYLEEIIGMLSLGEENNELIGEFFRESPTQQSFKLKLERHMGKNNAKQIIDLFEKEELWG